MNDVQENSAFFAIHSDLPREAPGDRASLDWAMTLARPPASGRVLDAGCGPGADIKGLLAHVPQGQVVAVDLHGPFVDQVRARFADDPRVQAVQGDMLAQPGPFDLIWAAGTLYAVGVETALQSLREGLVPGGHIAFSDLCWTGADRPAAVEAFFASEGLSLADEAELRARIARAGLQLRDTTTLPPGAWEAYYTPMDARLARLEQERPDDPHLARQIALHRDEIALWRSYGDRFGYILAVAGK